MSKFQLCNLFFATIVAENKLYDLRVQYQKELDEINFFKHKVYWNKESGKHRNKLEKQSDSIRKVLQKIDSVILHRSIIKRNPDILSNLNGVTIRSTFEEWLEAKIILDIKK